MMELLIPEIMDSHSYSSMKIFLPIQVFILRMFIKRIFEKVLLTAELEGKKLCSYYMRSLDFPCIHGLIKERGNYGSLKKSNTK